MTDNIPVEITTKYVTTVDELPEAWAFVMERLESVGPDPHIVIKPVRIYGWNDIGDDNYVAPRQFEVVVSGMVNES